MRESTDVVTEREVVLRSRELEIDNVRGSFKEDRGAVEGNGGVLGRVVAVRTVLTVDLRLP